MTEKTLQQIIPVNTPSSHVTASPTAKFSKGLHVGLWIVQILLAIAFSLAGAMKTTQPIGELTKNLGWPGVVPVALVRLIGAAEFAAALGLLLPAATRIRPALTSAAAIGLVLVMLFAAIFHGQRGEMQALPINLILGFMAAFVAWGRSKGAPIVGR